MRKYLSIVALMSVFASCGSSEPETIEHANAEHAKTTETPKLDVAQVKAGKMDPVCEMTFDESWTESTVYMSDTIRFCSENCKTAFVARPEKYLKAE